jgi:hypothetical protein
MEELPKNATYVTPVGVMFVVCMGILTSSLRRQNALIPLLVTTCYMPLGQVFVVAGLHFLLFRVVLLVGLLRVFSRKESSGLTFTRLDRLFVYWALVTLVLGTVAEPSMERFINRSGEVYDAAGAYFLFRCWMRSIDEVVGVVRFLAWMIAPLAVSMLVEGFTRRNIFSALGGVAEITGERDGTLRCQGAFRHPILAGTYAATLFPLFVALWFRSSRDKRLAIVGACSAVAVNMAAHSSGSFLALIGAILGFALWPARFKMRLLRWGTVLTFGALALLMEAPVWYLIARMSDIVGGTGWHRSYLIDQAVDHFSEWWVVGSTYTANWAPGYGVLGVDPKNMDITNQYIAEGLGGGILKLGLFIAMIVFGFKTIGRWMRKLDGTPLYGRIFIWALGVCLSVHCVSFFSISYFDQIIIMWFWLLAILSMLADRRVWIHLNSAVEVTAQPAVAHAHQPN